MTTVTLKMPKSYLDRLKQWIEESDYCYLCDNHPSGGHVMDCPFYEIDIDEEQQRAIDDGTLDLDDL